MSDNIVSEVVSREEQLLDLIIEGELTDSHESCSAAGHGGSSPEAS